ncbi:MAG TPA: hypothetical protein ENI87_00985, partial [bacterium]|nr:hypothetical protein [bacterium]
MAATPHRGRTAVARRAAARRGPRASDRRHRVARRRRATGATGRRVRRLHRRPPAVAARRFATATGPPLDLGDAPRRRAATPSPTGPGRRSAPVAPDHGPAVPRPTPPLPGGGRPRGRAPPRHADPLVSRGTHPPAAVLPSGLQRGRREARPPSRSRRGAARRQEPLRDPTPEPSLPLRPLRPGDRPVHARSRPLRRRRERRVRAHRGGHLAARDRLPAGGTVVSGAGYRAFVLQDAPLDEGTVLLEASAGTGKTYTLTGVLVRMLLEGTVEHIEQALVVTFTVAAADELKNRLRAALQQALRVCQGERDTDPFFASLAAHGTRGAQRLRRALDEFDQASVMTIHGFCKRLLDEAAFESEEPFELEFTVDEAPLWHAAAADALRLLRCHDGPMLGAVLHHMALQPDALVSLYRDWQRHPNADLTPSEPQPAVHLANLCAAVHRAKSHWDEDLLDLLATFEWLANKGPTRGDVRDYFARQAEPLHDHPELCLGLFHQLSPSQLRGRLKRKSIGRTDRPFFQACEEVTNELRRVKDHVRSELLLHMHTRLERHKRDRALATFDDLLARSHAAVCDPRRREHLLASLRQRYRVALIDEFQDTDERQYAILANTFRNRPLFLIGDPKQSIYAFRGADLQTYLRAADDAVERRTLARNFRSSRNLVAAVHQLFAGPNAFVEPRIRMPRIEANAGPDDLLVDEGGPALRFRLLEYEIGNPDKAKSINPNDARTRIVRDVVAEIRRLLDGPVRLRDGDRSRAIAPRDIAVLTRRNDDAMLVQEHLRAASVVSVIGKAGDVFLTDELVELERVLHAVLRPNDLRRVRAAMATRLWGFDAADLVRMSREAERFEEPWAQIERWRQLWLHRGFVVMKEQLFQDLDVAGRLLARRDGERRLTNLRQLCEMLHQAEHQRRLSPEGLVHWLAHERNHSDGLDPQRRELRLESDEDAVQILTMHGSKGLQYEVVFCPFLWSGRPALRTNVAVTGGDGDPLARRFAYEVPADDPGWLRSEAERLAEDVRLSYVALTRARRRCYVHWGPIAHGNTGYHYSALAWLLPPNTQDVR